MGYQSKAGQQEKAVDDLIQSGNLQEAIDACQYYAEYWRDEESDCDQAGDYADGMRASRQADEFITLAGKLRQSLKDASTASPEP